MVECKSDTPASTRDLTQLSQPWEPLYQFSILWLFFSFQFALSPRVFCHLPNMLSPYQKPFCLSPPSYYHLFLSIIKLNKARQANKSLIKQKTNKPCVLLRWNHSSSGRRWDSLPSSVSSGSMLLRVVAHLCPNMTWILGSGDDTTSHMAFFLPFSYVLVAPLSLVFLGSLHLLEFLLLGPPWVRCSDLLTFLLFALLGEHIGFMVLSNKCTSAIRPLCHVSKPLSESPKSLEASFSALLLPDIVRCPVGV